ncbi:MAG: aliphatic sulfonate ABC transporter substrate-binding protein [Treponema sp.]|nr:aliphatic sulfonate ABC transporter substrate-binding protein [Treponema sp.]
MKKITKVVVFALAAICAFSGCSKKNGSAGKQRVVNIAIQPSAAFMPIYLCKEKGWIEEALAASQVQVKWNEFESGPPINESLAAGLSDIGTNGDVPTVSAIAAGQKVTIVGVPGNGPDAYAMLAKADNSAIKSPADLKGKKIATVIGSTGHNLTKKLMEKYGMTLDDIELVNISAGDVGIVLSTNQVDAAVIWEPNVTRLVDNGTAKIIAQGSDTNLRGTNTFLARNDYIKNNPDVISIILEQYSRAVKALPTIDKETLQKVADDLKLSQEQVLKLYNKYGFAIQCDEVDTAALQDTCHFLVSIGRLENEYQVKDYVDNSYYNNSKAKDYLK